MAPPGNRNLITARLVGLWLAGLFFLCAAYFLPRLDWNENDRLDTAAAMVDHGTLRIDRYHWNSGDSIRVKGHWFSSKAVGESLVAAGDYWLVEHAFGARVLPAKRPWEGAQRLHLLGVEYLVTLMAVLPIAVGLLLMIFWFLGVAGFGFGPRALVSGTLALGTPIFPYSQNLYAHVPVAFFLFAAFALAAVPGPISGRGLARILAPKSVRVAAIGALLGASVLFEYPTVLPALIIGVYAGRRFGWPEVWKIAAGASVPLAVLGLLNVWAYGSPLATGYTSGGSSWNRQFGRGFAGFVLPPNPAALYGLTFSPYRGLFFLSPMLLLAPVGWFIWLRRDRLGDGSGARVSPPGGWTCAIVVGSFIPLISCYWAWTGGWSVGARYLIPVVPFFALPVAAAVQRAHSGAARAGVAILATASVVATWIETAARTFPPDTVSAPLFMHSLPQLETGKAAPNVGMPFTAAFGLGTGVVSLLPVLALACLWTMYVYRRSLKDPLGLLNRLRTGSGPADLADVAGARTA